MAYEIEAVDIALQAFVRDVCDVCELDDERVHIIEDATVNSANLVGDLAECDSQSSLNTMLYVAIEEVTNGDQKIQEAMAGSIDFFWQIYNDNAELSDWSE